MKILLLNTHSTLNPGDTAIVLASVGLLRSRWPRAAVSLTSRTPELDRPFYAARGIEVHPPLTPAPGVFAGTGRKLCGSAANLAGLGAKRRLLAAFRESDLVVAGGGGYLYSYGRLSPGPTFLQHWLHLRLARIWDRPTILFPQSFGPFANPAAARLCASVLGGANVRNIFAREMISWKLLRGLLGEGRAGKVAFCPDAVFLLEPGPGGKAEEFVSSLRRPVLALTLRDWHFSGAASAAERSSARERYLASLLEVSASFLRRWGGTVLVVPQVRGPDPLEDDTEISREFVRRFGPSGRRNGLIPAPPGILETPEEIIALLAWVDLVLATRFHSAVFALLGGTPAVTVGYQHKAAGMLRELGMERFLVEISAVSPVKILPLLDELMEDRGLWREKAAQSVADARKTIRSVLGAALDGCEAGGPPAGKRT